MTAAGDCRDLQHPALCAQLSHKLNQILARVTLFAATSRATSMASGGEPRLAGFTKPNADFGYDCRLINAIRNNKQAVADPLREGSARKRPKEMK